MLGVTCSGLLALRRLCDFPYRLLPSPCFVSVCQPAVCAALEFGPMSGCHASPTRDNSRLRPAVNLARLSAEIFARIVWSVSDTAQFTSLDLRLCKRSGRTVLAVCSASLHYS